MLDCSARLARERKGCQRLAPLALTASSVIDCYLLTSPCFVRFAKPRSLITRHGRVNAGRGAHARAHTAYLSHPYSPPDRRLGSNCSCRALVARKRKYYRVLTTVYERTGPGRLLVLQMLPLYPTRRHNRSNTTTRALPMKGPSRLNKTKTNHFSHVHNKFGIKLF